MIIAPYTIETEAGDRVCYWFCPSARCLRSCQLGVLHVARPVCMNVDFRDTKASSSLWQPRVENLCPDIEYRNIKKTFTATASLHSPSFSAF
jgi:hypothetical protein